MPKARVNSIELAYEVHGQGKPLVLAHGYTASKEMWENQIGPFSERYRVVVYDARGHGESEAPPADDPGYTLDTFVEDQRALMQHLGIDQAYIGGLSMGGMIAMRFALKHPEMTTALLLTDTAAGMGGVDRAEHAQWLENRRAIEATVRKEGAAAVMRSLYAQRAEAMGFPRPEDLPAGVQRHIARLQDMSADGFLGAGRALGEQESVLERLSEITVPTLILVGDLDVLRGPSEEMKKRLPDSQFTLIKGSTHGTCLWKPEAFTSAVLDFLSDVDAGRPVARREER